uniref:Uncharacterized protein n=1 Tax=Cacopsylla melanoneura TaxID=428564 RepID=A0A8D8YZ13_9HEMI
MSSNPGKSLVLSKYQFKKELQDTKNSQENVLNSLLLNTENKHVDALTEDQYLETLNDLENNDLESTLQTTLHLLDLEYNKLLKIQETSERDLKKLKDKLSQEIKQQRLNYTQSLLSNGDNHVDNILAEEGILKAEKNLELKVEHAQLSLQVDRLKQSLRPYENIPDSLELAEEKVRELEAELKSLELQISSAYSNTSMNNSM